MEEVWRPVIDFPNYEVSNLGRVRSLNYNNTGLVQDLSQFIVKNYFRVSIESKGVPVHQLVARCFVPNPENKPTIDHINRNKSDNRACNLRWATKEEQGQNKTYKPSNTGEPNIFLMPSGVYRLVIQRNHIQMKSYHQTLEQAVEARNKYLAEL